MSDIGWMQMWNDLKTRLSARTTWGRTQILEEMQKIESDKLQSLTQEPLVMYGAGYKDLSGGYAMFAGPNPDLSEILTFTPSGPLKDTAVILRFEKGREKEIYRWSDDQGWRSSPLQTN